MQAVIAIVLVSLGGAFFFAGTVGLLRFPDVFTRLHALAKADNVGLGFICLGLAVASGSLWVALKIFLIWFLALFASTVSCFLLARYGLYSMTNNGSKERRP
ncbi:cation:proton antiporter [Desulfurispira natronophila]|uniref:Multicomponent Na+:H+ antiporter subunit G n=1 Tax=Desulfurispira natronophila TaxID=682562 RepID=A0A7W7Y4S1_9BACT|nr:monovalent cation/H(+) antiporter subunit G [Desulfurispira natronophila]MBB5022070.1 multicomponent Na+:H+ antiporter subunit G [Desulfurispira natronophila]